jgi:2-polyprenyl-3-methyl-5-hydroxy-6-metoxy-1,4-benzoquinol methylase
MSLENVAVCPICSGNSFVPYLTCKDYTTTGETFHVKQCIGCNMLVTTPRPTENDAHRYYQSSKYISHTGTAAGIIDYIYLIVRGFTLNWKYKLVKRHLSKNKMLEYGCGTGSFLNYCIERGVDAYGIEPSAEARANHARIQSSLDSLSESDFDVITLWHVIEHVYSVNDILEKLKERLSKTGTIFIAVPNHKSDDAKHYGAEWAAYDVPRHLWHFSKTNMEALLAKHAFKLQAVLPMKLDSFYVSMLSEKNIAGGTLTLPGAINALRAGIRSNQKGSKDLNYSSLIYVAQK